MVRSRPRVCAAGEQWRRLFGVAHMHLLEVQVLEASHALQGERKQRHVRKCSSVRQEAAMQVGAMAIHRFD